MKSLTTALLALVLIFAVSDDAMAQRKSKKKKNCEPDTLSVSYNYGLLLGMSLQMQGVPADSINSTEILAGLEKALKNKLSNEQFETSQEIFTAKMGELQIKTLPSGVQYEVMKEGKGEKPSPTSQVTTHYHGTLVDGTVFDSSVERGEPATFPINGVIKGWQEVLPLMPVGSKWKVYIPSALAYGSRAIGNIPPNSVLIFEIELISIEKK